MVTVEDAIGALWTPESAISSWRNVLFVNIIKHFIGFHV